MDAGQTTTDGAGADVAAAQRDLARLLDGYLTTQLFYFAARLGVADVLADGPRTGREVAEAVGADPDALARLLRGLVIEDVLAEHDDGRLGLTAMGERLRDGVPGSMRGAALARGELYWSAAAGLLLAVTEGGTAFEHVHGQPFVAHLAADPAGEADFQASMAARAQREAAEVAAAYDFSAAHELVDVGGGSGVLLETVLRATPELRGVLVDRPEAVERARARMTEAGLDGRARCVVGDFFDAVPRGADAYLLSRVVHDWHDADAGRILTACRRAMPAGARLVLVEAIVPRRARDAPEAIRMDINMLMLFGTRERTEEEFRDLLATAGFALRRVVPTGSAFGLSVLEAVVASSAR
ncbi:MAG: methyltransferase [Solirubrobacteraceae bacterium]